MKLIINQENRNLARPQYSIGNENGKIVFRAKSRFLNYLIKKIDITDENGTKAACITQALLSITPKLKVSIEGGNSLVLSRKLSIRPVYQISGSPFEITGDINRSFIINKGGKQAACINAQGDTMRSKYILETSESDDILEYICIVLAMDAAGKIVSRMQNRS